MLPSLAMTLRPLELRIPTEWRKKKKRGEALGALCVDVYYMAEILTVREVDGAHPIYAELGH